jgi:hypothetical protein
MVGGESMARVCGGESLTDQTPTIQSNPIQSNHSNHSNHHESEAKEMTRACLASGTHHPIAII